MEALLIYNSDIEIIDDYVENGSNKAANAFVRKYQKFVYSTAFRYLKSYDDSQDAAQQVFIKALGNLKSFRKESSLSTWLYRITVNICTTMLRKKRVMSIFSSASDNNFEDYFSVESREATPLQELESKEFEEEFNLAFANLPQKQRETFALRYFDDLSYAEISDMLGTSIGGLKANYYQAVKKLGILLKK